MPKNRIKIEKITEVHRINFNGQIVLGSFEELEELCLALEEYLYEQEV